MECLHQDLIQSLFRQLCTGASIRFLEVLEFLMQFVVFNLCSSEIFLLVLVVGVFSIAAVIDVNVVVVVVIVVVVAGVLVILRSCC